jgi:CDGSH-type Zn-finger protein
VSVQEPVDPEGLAVLRALEPSSLTVGEIAATLGLDPDRAAGAVTRLEGAGLLQRVRDGERLAPSSAGLDRMIESPGSLEAPAPSEAAVITPYRDGPLVVRGSFRLVDQDGQEIETQRSTIALCRCGRSRIRPFCDGTHKQAGFTGPSAAEDRSRPARGA